MMGRIPNFTKRDFQWIADTFRGFYTEPDSEAEKTWLRIVEHFADALAETNGLYRREKFVRAATR